MESPNRQMWGARVSLGLLRPTRRARSNPGLLCLRRSVLRYVMVLSFKMPGFTLARGVGQELAWTQGDGVRAVFARFLKCVRGVARLSTVFGNWHISDIPKGVGGILRGESITCRGMPSAVRPRVSPLCRKIRVQTSPLCRKILEVGSFLPAESRLRMSPFCRIMEPSPPPPHHRPARIGGESGGNRPSGGSSERRRSASRGASRGHSDPDRGSNALK